MYDSTLRSCTVPCYVLLHGVGAVTFPEKSVVTLVWPDHADDHWNEAMLDFFNNIILAQTFNQMLDRISLNKQ